VLAGGRSRCRPGISVNQNTQLVQFDMEPIDAHLFRTGLDEDGTYSATASYHRANTATIFSALTFFGVERSAIVGASLRRVSFQDDDKRRN
jgi:hypothetical protein